MCWTTGLVKRNSCVIPAFLCAMLLSGQQPFYDGTHKSKIFGESRHYRIFLPQGYGESGQRYPVIYYFHGSSDRYTLEKYDGGLETVPEIAAYVGAHDVIVVAVDGYVARDYSGFYGGMPYDVARNGGDFDFGEYFLELARHIDSTYRTLATRRYRATSGLSMGGFMSLYLSARYPDRIGSASAFNPGPEFFVGEKARRSLWRPKDFVSNHENTMIRLVRASGDYLGQYTAETQAAYAIAPRVNFEFRQDEYHRHWATSIAETLDFHMRAFADPKLSAVPDKWNYSSAFQSSSAWGYQFDLDISEPSVLYLEHVTQGGMRVRTRRWAPDGPRANCTSLNVTTAPRYQPYTDYRLLDYDLAQNKETSASVPADAEGRIHLRLNCDGHEIGINGPGANTQHPVLLPLTNNDTPRVLPGQSTSLPIRIFNPDSESITALRAELTSGYPTVEIVKSVAVCPEIAAGQIADISSAFQVRFTAGDGDFTHARLRLNLNWNGNGKAEQNIDVLVAPANLEPPLATAILDGRTETFRVFRQKGNQGGGDSMNRTVKEGSGDGNGVLDRGEQATIWIKLKQGLDPFDKDNWCRTKVYGDSRLLTEVSDIQETKQREWTGAQNRTSLVSLSRNVPPGTEIPVILDCESYSFNYTPDVRYGREFLYQAFQFHKHHLFAWKWTGRP